MQLLLVNKGVWDSVVTPSNDANDKKARTLIGLSIEDHFLPTIKRCTTAKQAWDALETLYQSQSQARLLQLKRQLSTVRLLPSEPLAKYAARAQAIRDQMEAAGSSIDEKDLVLAILDGLPQEYDTVSTTILTSSDAAALELPTVLSKLLLVEQRHSSHSNNPNTALYTSVLKPGQHQHGGGGGGGFNREMRTCHYCKKQGHLIKDCWQKKAADEARAQSGYAETLALIASVPC